MPDTPEFIVTGALRVLVIEDDRKAARILARGLRDEGFLVDVSHSVDDGNTLAMACQYDAILVDYVLPDGDGPSLCRGLRARGLGMPIIMVTARDAPEYRLNGLRAGADDYLTKPFAFEDLVGRLHALLREPSHSAGAVLKSSTRARSMTP